MNATTTATVPSTTKYDEVLTASECAAMLNMTARKFRRQARKAGNGVGRGNIYALPIATASDVLVLSA